MYTIVLRANWCKFMKTITKLRFIIERIIHVYEEEKNGQPLISVCPCEHSSRFGKLGER